MDRLTLSECRTQLVELVVLYQLTTLVMLWEDQQPYTFGTLYDLKSSQHVLLIALLQMDISFSKCYLN